MPLTLRIENMASLPDGGPISVTSTGLPVRVGRKPGNDWILPDPSNWISGFHFEVARVDQAWFLTDRSSNGTFLVGQSYRLEGSYRLNNGDRLQVGHYYIAVAITPDAAPVKPPPPPQASGLTQAPFATPRVATQVPQPVGAPSPGLATPPAAPAAEWGQAPAAYRAPPVAEEPDPWAVGPAATPAIAPPSAPLRPASPVPGFTPPPFSAPPLPPAVPPVQPVVSPIPPPPEPRPAVSAFGSPGIVGGSIGVPSAPPVAPPIDTPASAPSGDFSADFIVTRSALAQGGTPFPQAGALTPPAPAVAPAGYGVAAATPRPPAAPMPAPELQPASTAPQPPASGDAFLKAFCEGAGLSAADLGGVMTEALAHELGRTIRIVAAELMAMLQDRAMAKRFTRGGERTMISTENNNPLKFLPDATQALEAMFLKPRAGFLKGGDGVAAGLADVRLHQAAVFAAIQPALAGLLADLAPESIDDGSDSAGMFGGQNKKRLWEVYVERWDAKAGSHDNGMLDVFLALFAESYAAAVDAARKQQQ